MNVILEPKQMRAADADTIRLMGLSSWRLMENAAIAATQVLQTLLKPQARLVICCGNGNNGGDGFAMARLMRDYAQTRIVFVGSVEAMSEETRQNYDQCLELGIPILNYKEEMASDTHLADAECIVDALIGVGGSAALRGPVLSLLKTISRTKALKVAVDLPTGLDGLSGEAHELVFKADHTLTMACLKKGMCKASGPSVCGQIHVLDIGIPDAIMMVHAETYYLLAEDFPRYVPTRLADSSKFDYGRVCIVAGSRDMPGAAALCANAAIRSGAGLVELCSTSFHASVLPEILQTHLKSDNDGHIDETNYDTLLSSCSKANVLVFGCGAGAADCTKRVFRRLIETFHDRKRIIVDADALRALDKNKHYGPNLVVTPHAGEMTHLLGESHSEEAINAFLRSTGVLLVLKQRPVAIRSLVHCIWNVNGNPGMATAGSGDLLAGILGGYLARLSKYHPLSNVLIDEVACAVMLHAHAGDLAAERYSQEAMSASHILEQLPQAWLDLLSAGDYQ